MAKSNLYQTIHYITPYPYILQTNLVCITFIHCFLHFLLFLNSQLLSLEDLYQLHWTSHDFHNLFLLLSLPSYTGFVILSIWLNHLHTEKILIIHDSYVLWSHTENWISKYWNLSLYNSIFCFSLYPQMTAKVPWVFCVYK